MKLVSSLSLALLLLAVSAPPIEAKPLPATSAATMRNRYKHAYISVSGANLVTRDGRRVLFHGVNLGGWLVTEGWMCGLADSADTVAQSGSGGVAGRSALESLEARFGADQGAALMDIWQSHWITTEDLDRIRDSGFNVVRVPISYRTLQHADGSWIRDSQGEIDFTRMDWIVREAAARGIYTIFDLHVWPQQRTDQARIGRPEGANIRQAMADLWTVIATHYRGNGAIAAFDLINEFPGNWGVQQVLSRAVAGADPHRAQVVEGFTFAQFLKLRQAGNFPNGIYSDHFYGTDPLTNDQMAKRLQESAGSTVPVYIGEFLAADFATATRTMDQAGVGWSSWTYKTVDMGEWGIINYARSAATDIEQESSDEIAAKWSNNFNLSGALSDKSAYYTNDKRTYAVAIDPLPALN